MANNNSLYKPTFDDFDNMCSDGMIRFALDDDLTVLYANQSSYNIIGTSEPIKRLIDYIPDNKIAEFKESLSSLELNKQTTCYHQFIKNRTDTAWIAFNLLLTDITYNNIPTVLCSISDKTNIQKYRSEIHTTFNNIRCGIVHFNIHSSDGSDIRIINANNFYYNMPGNSKNNRRLNIYTSDIDILMSALAPLKLTEAKNPAIVEFRAVDDNDVPYWINATIILLCVENGRNIYMALIRDVTAQHQAKYELEKARDHFSLAMNNDDIVFEYNYAKNECLLFYLKDSTHITIKNFREEVRARKLIHPDDFDKIYNMLKTEKIHEMECRLNKSDCEDWVWYHLNGNIVKENKSKKFMGTFHNINNLKTKETLLTNKAQIDTLTNVYNRDTAVTLINEFLSQNPNSNSYLCVIDLDNFKNINDTFGHLYGDAVLNMAASAIKHVISDDNIVARFGGDEFLMFLKSSTVPEITAMCNDIIKSILQLRSDINDVDGISCSIGIVHSSAVKEPRYNSLFKLADKALYKAKNTGKSKFAFYDPSDSYFIEFADMKYSKLFEQPNFNHYNEHDITSLALEILERTSKSNDAIRMFLKHIGLGLKLEKIKIMQVNQATNEVAIAYAWARDLNEPDKSGKSGFYAPEDIKEYIDLFNKSTVVQFHPSVIKKFTPKMQDQLNKLSDRTVFYGAVIDKTDIFSLILYQTDDLERVWTPEDMSTLQELTKIISMYLSKNRKIEDNNRRMEELLNYDELTSTYTFKKFREKAQELIDQNPEKQFMLVYYDFVHFKYINDLYGFEVGDEILHDFADFLHQTSTHDNFILARITGDEFASIFTVDSLDSLDSFITDMDNLNAHYCNIKNEKYPLANILIKCGVYNLKEGDNAVSAIDHANIAKKSLEHLTVCKSAFFDENMYKRLLIEADMSRSMRSALKNDEFTPFLQPKVNITTSEIIGAEALVRWFKSDGSFVPPFEFIPYFERNGFVTQVDFYIFTRVVQLINKWLTENLPTVPISVNLSRVNARELDLADKIISYVEQYNVPPHLIEFEVTETVFGDIDPVFIGNLQKLRDYGFSIDIDDFGSGYSSLNMLSEIPADIIKLDKTLLTRSLESPRKAKIIRHVIDMAFAIDYDVICEGVETEEEVAFLNSIGCKNVQGYYFAKPMPIKDFNELLLIGKINKS